MLKSLDEMQFDNRFTRDLPADPDTSNRRREVLGACFARVSPTHVKSPSLVAYAREVGEELDLSPKICESSAFVDVFSGNSLLANMEPYATCYGGHQFGNWAGQLGDGRAINLGEIVNREGKRWALQLKGAGPTPFSRSADGLAVLRSSVREFLCSEAMYHLGVPTTRALSLMLTGEQVVREMFYDGNAQPEPGAVVCRVAPSFTRFGTFQIFSARGDIALLRQFVDYTIGTDFPHLGNPSKAVYLEWFEEVCQKTLTMVLHWERVGFVHGVMNTDNMSILGLTIDYGPYGWLEDYDPNWTPNTTDAGGRRYRFGNQAEVGLWNLIQLAQGIYPLIEEAEPLEKILENYKKEHVIKQGQMMAVKLGLTQYESVTDAPLIEELLQVLQVAETDMTIFFRNLANINAHDLGSENQDSQKTDLEDQSDEFLLAPLMEAYYHPDALGTKEKSRIAHWLRQYINRLNQDDVSHEDKYNSMNAVNPKYVLRNYLAQLAIDKSEQGDHSMVNELLEVLRKPYEEQEGKASFAEKRPEWARNRAGCSMLSCSS
ncbi:MAG: YdiU family protein [Pseudomonadales bacterium]|nr:YdiU family protein [Pseudomonadales bacterium]